jgi:FtsH-binding integral membrane protein
MANFDRNAYPAFGGQAGAAGGVAYDQGLRSYMLGIYNHMILGLAISGLVAFGLSTLGLQNPLVQALYNSPLKWVVMLAPLAFVFFISFRFANMSYTALLGTFWAFAFTMGLSLGSIFFVYKMGSIANAFFATAAAFGAMSLWGYTTKRNLTGMGTFLVMGLFGVVIVSLLNVLFFKLSGLAFAINILVVVISAGLTAWDTQRLKTEYDYVVGDAVMMGKASVMGALSLYLNFINMFTSILSIFGNRE